MIDSRWMAATTLALTLSVLAPGCDLLLGGNGPASVDDRSSPPIESRSSNSNISTVTAPDRACGDPSVPVVTIEPFGRGTESGSSSQAEDPDADPLRDRLKDEEVGVARDRPRADLPVRPSRATPAFDRERSTGRSRCPEGKMA